MILNRQRTVRVARRPLELFLHRLQQQLGLAAADVTICMVSDAEIARMNQAFRHKKGPTDVLSFPAFKRRTPLALPRTSRRGSSPGLRSPAVTSASRRRPHQPPASQWHSHSWLCPEDDPKCEANACLYLGDIAISPATARRNAKQYRRTLPNELQILILHGVLHLLGYDHETDRGKMHRIEQTLRRRLGLA